MRISDVRDIPCKNRNEAGKGVDVVEPRRVGYMRIGIIRGDQELVRAYGGGGFIHKKGSKVPRVGESKVLQVGRGGRLK